jgi:hypothetical protein
VAILNLWGQFFQPGATARIDNGITSISLASSTVVSSTMITGTLDLSSAAGGPWDVIVTNPDSQSGIATNTFTVTVPITFSYGATATCSAGITDCSACTEEPDNSETNIEPGGVITVDMGIGNGIMNGRGYDFVFYEWWNPDSPPAGNVQLDDIMIELSADGDTWYEVFNWGDGYTPAMDDYTSVVDQSNDADGEVDNEIIPSTLLYGTPPIPPHPTGILIDINFLGSPPNTVYRYVRLSCPSGGGDAAQVDTIERLR